MQSDTKSAVVSKSPPSAPRRSIMDGIQHLRGIAACAVVVHHTTDSYPDTFISRLDLGLSGVATFFAISGFIIWTSSRHETPKVFIRRRLLRIVPMYWLAIIIVLAIGIHSWGKPIFSARAIIYSLFFIPYFSGPNIVTPYPVLIPGWTLNLEMLFYAVFAIAMIVQRPVVLPTMTMILLFGAGYLFDFNYAPLVLYTKWVIVLFAAGLLIGWLAPTNRWIGSAWPVGGLLVIGCNLLPYAHLMLAVGVVILIAGVSAKERRSGWAHFPSLKVVGNSSYSIYLFHMPCFFIINAGLNIVFKDKVSWVTYAIICTGLSIAAGIFMHTFVEQPIGQLLKRKVERKLVF